jgi:hypothetical protein
MTSAASGDRFKRFATCWVWFDFAVWATNSVEGGDAFEAAFVSFLDSAAASMFGAADLPKLKRGALSFLVISALPHRGHCTKWRVSWL